jgi:RNA polymerase sigma-70 factor (ECF subfamily)
MRVPVLLHYYADLTIAEVARAVRRPEGTVKRLLFDARSRLHLMLDEVEQ